MLRYLCFLLFKNKVAPCPNHPFRSLRVHLQQDPRRRVGETQQGADGVAGGAAVDVVPALVVAVDVALAADAIAAAGIAGKVLGRADLRPLQPVGGAQGAGAGVLRRGGQIVERGPLRRAAVEGELVLGILRWQPIKTGQFHGAVLLLASHIK